MKFVRALGYVGMAAAAVVVTRLGLDLAVNDLGNADPKRERQLANASSEAPQPTLAPVMTPSPQAWSDDGIAVQATDTGGFGSPDPEFGQANPAVGEPAWGAAERQRQAEAAEAAAKLQLAE